MSGPALLVTLRAWAQALHNQQQILKELEKMAREVEDLRTEIAKESEEDVLSAQTITDLNNKVGALQEQLDQVQPLIDAARQGETDALAQLESVLDEIRQAVEELRADNPVETNPDAHPDQTLPGDLPHVEHR